MTPTRSVGWRAAEAALLAAFAYAVGLGPGVAVALGLLALGVSVAELAGARYGHRVSVRDVACALALVVAGAFAVSRGAPWIVIFAGPLAAWFLVDALAARRTDDDARPNSAASAVEADLAGELLRELRDGPRSPAALADALDGDAARIERACAALAADGPLARDGEGRYRVAADATPDALAFAARLGKRVVEPLRVLGLVG
ncbi:MAG: hypothetical protein ABEJ80_08690 [Halarchaeum sp.]